MFPIIDLRGNVIAFGGRSMEDSGPKYLNSNDTPVFKKSRNLFALNFAKNSQRKDLILCEGYMDVISMHQAGFDNAVAALGTALTDEQARLISKYAAKVILAYDSDAPGQTAAKRAMDIFEKAGIKVHVLEISGAKDPDEFIQKYGAERFDMLLEGSANALEYQIKRLKGQYDLGADDGKVGYLKEFSRLMADVSSPIEREVYLSRTAEEMGVSKQMLALQVQGILDNKERGRKSKERKDMQIYVGQIPNTKHDLQRSRHIKAALAEERLLAALMKNPDYIQLMDGLPAEYFTVESNRILYSTLTGRLRNNESISMIHLSGILEPSMTARLAGYAASAGEENPTEREVMDYIEAIKEQQEMKTEKEIAQMDKQQFKEYISKLAAKKK